MAINAEQLNIILAARDKEFTKAMDRANRRVQAFASKSQKELSGASMSFDLLGKAAARLGPLLAGAFAVSGLQNIAQSAIDIGNLSNVAGVSAEKFQGLAFAASNFGVEQDKLADILKDVNDKFGDYVQTGAGPLADFFENIGPKVGLTAKNFADLSSDQKLGAYINALEKANLSQADMTFYLEALASDATLLKGAFANNGAELDRLTKKFSDAGAVMSQDMINKAKEAKEEFDLASKVISAQFSIALADLLPVITDLASFIAAAASNIGVFYEAIQKLINPNYELEKALDNTTLAMGDEIRESQNLAMALGQSTNMSVSAAIEKLKEAKQRYSNVEAIIAEQKALKLGSDEYEKIVGNIQIFREAINSLSVTTADGAIATAQNAEALERYEQGLADALVRQRDFLKAEEATAEQLKTTKSNIKILEDALENAANGFVSFGDQIFETTGLTARLDGKLKEGPIRSLQDLVARLKTAKEKAEVFNDVIFDPRDPNYDPVVAEFARLQMGLDAVGESGQKATDKIAEGFNKIKELSPEMQRLNSIMQGVESSMEQAFMSMFDGTTSAKDAFKAMASDIIKELYRIFVAKQVTGFITGAVSLFSGGSLIGFGSGMGGGRPAPDIPRRAMGGPVSAGSPYLVGERGPELIVPNRSGTVIPNNQLGGGTVVVNQTINVSTGVQQTVRAEIKGLMPQIAESAKAAVSDAKRRGGSYGRAFA